MKELTAVDKRKNKRTGEIEYIGTYKYYSDRSWSKNIALITKSTYDYFKKKLEPKTPVN
ncbi:MAG: hypothetical protein V1720_00395 [bacterium]